MDYHDREWGFPEYDDHNLFELLVLESFQAGLSWECVLNKREDFREAFDNFDLEKICGYDEEKIKEIFRNSKDQIDINSKIENASTLSQLVDSSSKLLKENRDFLHMIYNELDE